MGSRSSSGVFTNVLRQLAVPEMPISECKQKFYKRLDPKRHICAGGEKGLTTIYIFTSIKNDIKSLAVVSIPNNLIVLFLLAKSIF